MKAPSLSPRNRAIGLVVVASIIMMGSAIASTGLAAIHPTPANQNLTVADSPPAAPTALAATAIYASEIGLSWTNPLGFLTDNHVYLWNGTSCTVNTDGANEAIDLGGAYSSYAATPLTPTTYYSFEVTASNSSGEGPTSDCVTAITLPPGAPTGLAATPVFASEIGLSWVNPLGFVTDNRVYIWIAASCSGSSNEAIDLDGVSTSYAASDLTPSTNDSFEVTASTSGVEGPPSNCATASTLPAGAPTGLAVTAISSTEIGLSWTNPSGSLTGNNVYVWIGASCSGSPSQVIDLGGVYTSYPDSGLTPSTNYSFEVTANTSGVEGPRSDCVIAIMVLPGAPTALTATTISASKIHLKWTNPSGTLTANTVYEYPRAARRYSTRTLSALQPGIGLLA